MTELEQLEKKTRNEHTYLNEIKNERQKKPTKKTRTQTIKKVRTCASRTSKIKSNLVSENEIVLNVTNTQTEVRG